MKRQILALIAATALTGPVTAESPPPTPAETAIGLQYRGNHVAMRVADLDAAVTWWRDLFGAQEVRRSAVPALDPQIQIAFLHISGGFHIELIGGGAPAKVAPPVDIAADYDVAGYKHIGFLVADLRPVLAHLERHGVTAEYRVTRADYGVEIVLIREPSGHFVELYAPLISEGMNP